MDRLSIFEAPFKMVGLYNVTPATRGTVIGAAVAILLWYKKPFALFTQDGTMRPSEWFKPKDPDRVPVGIFELSALLGLTAALVV